MHVDTRGKKNQVVTHGNTASLTVYIEVTANLDECMTDNLPLVAKL